MKEQKKSDEALMNLRIPRPLLDEFKQAAKAKDETASQAVRKFIRQYVKQSQAHNRPQAQG